MLIHELGDVVDVVVDHAVEILLGVVLGNILVGELLDGGHCVGRGDLSIGTRVRLDGGGRVDC